MHSIIERAPALEARASGIAALIALVAGAYRFTPLKTLCLDVSVTQAPVGATVSFPVPVIRLRMMAMGKIQMIRKNVESRQALRGWFDSTTG